MNSTDTINEMNQTRELSHAIEKLVDIHLETIKQNREMIAALDSLVEQNDILIVELTEQKKEQDQDDGYVTLMSGEKLRVK